jgi:hypothetical protein
VHQSQWDTSTEVHHSEKPGRTPYHDPTRSNIVQHCACRESLRNAANQAECHTNHYQSSSRRDPNIIWRKFGKLLLHNHDRKLGARRRSHKARSVQFWYKSIACYNTRLENLTRSTQQSCCMLSTSPFSGFHQRFRIIGSGQPTWRK